MHKALSKSLVKGQCSNCSFLCIRTIEPGQAGLENFTVYIVNIVTRSAQLQKFVQNKLSTHVYSEDHKALVILYWFSTQ